MRALYNEIAHLAKSNLAKKACVLIVGKRCDWLKQYFSDYEVICCENCQENDLDKLVQQKSERFDAAIVLYKFADYTEYTEAAKFLSIVISLVKVGGFLQICEYTGDSPLNLSQYTNRFELHRVEGLKTTYGLSLVWEQCLRDTIYTRNDWNDHCWFFKKYECHNDKKEQNIRAFLDGNQYTGYGIQSYEWIFGSGFISPGGAAQNAQFLAQLDLKPGETVLDIGCGIGGNAFQIAKEYGASVIGVDLSSNMVTVACDRACLRRDTRVRFMIADITKYDFPPNTFEVVYSRDAIIHIPDKKALFTKCLKWLKPGGRLLITDYTINEDEQKLTKDFKQYLALRNYALGPLKQYANAAQEAGFQNVETIDLTDQFKKTIETEILRAEHNKIEFLQMFSSEKFDHLLDGWKNKIQYIDSGCHKWGLLKATKQP